MRKRFGNVVNLPQARVGVMMSARGICAAFGVARLAPRLAAALGLALVLGLGIELRSHRVFDSNVLQLKRRTKTNQDCCA